MLSKLPPEMEAKRVAIAKTNNLLVVLLIFPLVASFFVYVFATGEKTLGHQNDLGFILLWIAPPVAWCFGGFLLFGWGISILDRYLSIESGFVCAQCGHPLFCSDSYFYVSETSAQSTGLCPVCHTPVEDKTISLIG